MTNILLNGCNGKMGRVITDLVTSKENARIVAGIDLNPVQNYDFPVFSAASECTVSSDVIIDFSHPSALELLLKYALSTKTPIVVATTGLSSAQVETLRKASAQIPVFYSANMAIGICLLKDLVKKAALFLGNDFDIEIVERHHNQKLDAPSGTALAIADAINSVNTDKYQYIYDRHSKSAKRNKHEIGISAVRGGNIVGDHEVIFAGNNEVLEINHYAMSRNIFADGAVRAALFMKSKEPGFYDMNSLIEYFNE